MPPRFKSGLRRTIRAMKPVTTRSVRRRMITNPLAAKARVEVRSAIEQRLEAVSTAIRSGSKTLRGEWLLRGDYLSLAAFALLHTTRRNGKREHLLETLTEILTQHQLGNLGNRETETALTAAFEQTQ